MPGFFSNAVETFRNTLGGLANSLTPGKRKRNEDEAEDSNRPAARPRLETEQADNAAKPAESIDPGSQFATDAHALADLDRTKSTAGVLRTSLVVTPISEGKHVPIQSGPSTPAVLEDPPEVVGRFSKQPPLSRQGSIQAAPKSHFRESLPRKFPGVNQPQFKGRAHAQKQGQMPWQMQRRRMMEQPGLTQRANIVRNRTGGSGRWRVSGQSFAAQPLAKEISPEQDLLQRDAYHDLIQNFNQEPPRPQISRAESAVVDLESYPSRRSRQNPMSAAPSRYEGTGPWNDYRSELPKFSSFLRPQPQDSTFLALGRFDSEKVKESREEEEKLQQRRAALERCRKLTGNKQQELLSRVSAALHETKQNTAREASKASMKIAEERAEALKKGDEIARLEEASQNYARDRKARLEAFQAAQSAVKAVKPTQFWSEKQPKATRSPLKEKKPLNGLASHTVPKKSPLKKRPAKAAKEDVVDLMSSSEDEAEPSQGQEDEGRQGLENGDFSGQEDQSGSGEEDGESSADEDGLDISREFRKILVDDRRVTPHFPRLSKRQFKLYRDALARDEDQEVEMFLHKSSNIGVTRGLMACMRPRTWLNDEVMNITMGLLQERDRDWREAGKEYPKCHFFNTFFFNKLYLDKKKYDYSAVSRWTLPKKLKLTPQPSKSILDCDRVIAPVHLGCHWTCAMADLKNKEFVYFDSMLDEANGVMESLVRYIADEYKDKRKEDVDTTSWPVRYRKDIPRQLNGYDCGIFALMFAESLARGGDMDFSQSDMEYFRVMLTACIMDQKLISEFDE